MSKILGVIPARFADAHFPGKVLEKIGNRTVLEWVYWSALSCPEIDKIVVATDDERVREIAIQNNIDYLMTLETHKTGTDRLVEVAEYFKEYDMIVNIQGNMPGVNPEIIRGVIQLKKSEPEWTVTTAARPFLEGEDPTSPRNVKVVMSRKKSALYFSRSLIPFPRHIGIQSVYMHLGIYVFTRDFLYHFATLPPSSLEQTEYLEQLRILENDYSIGVFLTNQFGMGVDLPEDLQYIQQYYKSKGSF